MAVDVSALGAAIIAELTPSADNQDLADALAKGFVDMWTTASTGPSDALVSHSMAGSAVLLLGATMSAAAIAELTWDFGNPAVFGGVLIVAVSNGTANYINASGFTNVALPPETPVSHTHAWSDFFGDPATATGIAASIISEWTTLFGGAGGPGIVPFAEAFATGLCNHLEVAATTSVAGSVSPATHVHILE